MPPDLEPGAAGPASDAGVVAATNDAATTPAADGAADGAANGHDAKPTIDQDLRKVWDRLNQPRENGRFVSPNKDANGAAVAADTTAAAAEGAADTTKDTTPSPGQSAETPATEQSAKAAIDPPLSWSGENKAKWGSVPPDLQAYIAQRDKEQHEAISRAGNEVKAFEPVAQVIDQFGEVFRRNNLPPADGIARMLAMEAWLGAKPEEAVTEIAKAYNVDLTKLTTGQAAQAAGQDQGTQAVDPRVSTLETRLAASEAKLREVGSFLTNQQRAQLEREDAALAKEVADFSSKQKDGKPLHPHFEVVRVPMAALMQAYPAISMDEAYDRACYADPEIRLRIQADQRKADEEKQAKVREAALKDAKKNAGINVKSGPSAGSTPKTMDDTLQELKRKLYNS